MRWQRYYVAGVTAAAHTKQGTQIRASSRTQHVYMCCVCVCVCVCVNVCAPVCAGQSAMCHCVDDVYTSNCAACCNTHCTALLFGTRALCIAPRIP